MNPIIIAAFLIAILTRLLKQNKLVFVLILIADIVLTTIFNRGIISNHFWINLIELFQQPLGIVFLIAWIILISDWYIRFKHLKTTHQNT